jgi:GNAT superfamily N-acetyltransferase
MTATSHHDIMMVRPTMQNLPHYPVPTPFALRWYQPGDGQHWTDIHLEADLYSDITPELFQREFGTDEAELGQRQAYLLNPDGLPIGTASAWYADGKWGENVGMVHWVAMRPQWQGQGLAKPLLSAICTKLSQFGYERTILQTSTARIPAVNLYLHFGFQPLLRHEADTAVWHTLQPHLKYPIQLD